MELRLEANKAYHEIEGGIMNSKQQKDLAEWIYGENRFGQDGYRCSACRFFVPWYYDFTKDIDFIRGYHYCPHCGKRMVTYTGKKE